MRSICYAFAAILVTVSAANARMLGVAVADQPSGFMSCVGNTCVWGAPGFGPAKIIHVPPPVSAEDRAAAAKREADWVARCHPVVVADRYGVGRYHYDAPGCEFGR